MSEKTPVKNQNTGVTFESVISSVSDKFTAEELIQLLPHLTNLQESQNPNIALAMDGIKECQNQTNQTIRELTETEISSYAEELHKAETFEEKKYWAEYIDKKTRENTQTIREVNEHNNNTWIKITLATAVSAIAALGYLARRR